MISTDNSFKSQWHANIYKSDTMGDWKKIQGCIFLFLWHDWEQVCSGNFWEPPTNPGQTKPILCLDKSWTSCHSNWFDCWQFFFKSGYLSRLALSTTCQQWEPWRRCSWYALQSSLCLNYVSKEIDTWAGVGGRHRIWNNLFLLPVLTSAR